MREVRRQVVILAISGSREGSTDWQRAALWKILSRPTVTGIVHGDCVGLDDEADAMAARLGLWRGIYPSKLEWYRAHCERRGAEVAAAPAPPLARNPLIVERGEWLVACPRASSRGTWHAVREAKRLGRGVLVLGESSIMESISPHGAAIRLPSRHGLVD